MGKLFLLHGIWRGDIDTPLPPCPYILSASPDMTQCVIGEHKESTKHTWKPMIYFITLICTNWNPWRKSSLSKVSWLVAEPDLRLALYPTPLLPWSPNRGIKKVKTYIGLLIKIVPCPFLVYVTYPDTPPCGEPQPEKPVQPAVKPTSLVLLGRPTFWGYVRRPGLHAAFWKMFHWVSVRA